MKSTSSAALARQLGISPARGMEATMKAQLITAVLRGIEAQHLTHAQVARRSGLPRSAVTGILSGSLQKVMIDRVLKLVEAVGLSPRSRSSGLTQRRRRGQTPSALGEVALDKGVAWLPAPRSARRPLRLLDRSERDLGLLLAQHHPPEPALQVVEVGVEHRRRKERQHQ